MIKHVSLILLVFLGGLLPGCEENYQSQFKTCGVSDSEYESRDVRKAMDEAKIKCIENRSELDNAWHKIQMLAADNNVDIVAGDVDVMSVNYAAVDSLLEKLPVELDEDSPILVASFVNLDNLEESSTFGRLISEQFSSRFKQKGYTTLEMKLRTTVFIKQRSGEFLLSRELSDIGTKHRAQAVVVGTYAPASRKVYLTVRVINVASGQILASHDYRLPMTADVFKMLLKGRQEADWL